MKKPNVSGLARVFSVATVDGPASGGRRAPAPGRPSCRQRGAGCAGLQADPLKPTSHGPVVRAVFRAHAARELQHHRTQLSVSVRTKKESIFYPGRDPVEYRIIASPFRSTNIRAPRRRSPFMVGYPMHEYCTIRERERMGIATPGPGTDVHYKSDFD